MATAAVLPCDPGVVVDGRRVVRAAFIGGKLRRWRRVRSLPDHDGGSIRRRSCSTPTEAVAFLDAAPGVPGPRARRPGRHVATLADPPAQCRARCSCGSAGSGGRADGSRRPTARRRDQQRRQQSVPHLHVHVVPASQGRAAGVLLAPPALRRRRRDGGLRGPHPRRLQTTIRIEGRAHPGSRHRRCRARRGGSARRSRAPRRRRARRRRRHAPEARREREDRNAAQHGARWRASPRRCACSAATRLR